MQRLILAILLVALAAAALAFVASRIARAVSPSDGSSPVATRSSMQKIAFFLLLCLIIYVSMSGAS
jgi:hypothetical protein